MALVVFVRGVNVGGHRSFRPAGREIVRLLTLHLPAGGKWLVTLLARECRYVFGLYRRDMKVIGLLGSLDRIFGVPATTRNWTTIAAIVRALGGTGGVAESPGS